MDDCLIAPDGDIVPVSGVGGHIQTVIAYPEIFGYTREGIKKIYKDHEESTAEEGFARDIILTDLYKKGWIRVGFFLGDDATVDLWTLDSRTLGNLRQWARETFAEMPRNIAGNASVFVYTLSDGAAHSASLRDLGRGIIAFKKIVNKKLSFRK